MDLPYFVARVLHDGATLSAGGFWFFQVLLRRHVPAACLTPADRFVATAAVAAFVLLGLRTFALSAVLTDPPVTAQTIWSTLVDYLTTTEVGAVVAARLVIGGLVVAAIRRGSDDRLVGVPLILFVALRGLEGHAMAREGPAFVIHAIAAMAHQIALAGWIGLLPALLLWLRAQNGDPIVAHLIVRGVGQVAAPLVAVLVVSGITLSALMLGSPEALWTEDYGRWLTAKLAVFSLILCLAAVNRWGLTPYIAGAPAARHMLFATVVIELVLACIAIVLALLMSSTHPPMD